jgi:glycosyltransferase involved in cell wall biosynthesis
MHILQITNHGLHQWDVIPGLPDTGGQNIFVNEFSQALADLGFEITIVNRGGYPDPVTGEWRAGWRHKDERQRILYIEDGLPEFVRKEDMDARIPHLVEALKSQLGPEETQVDLIISHYWDGAKLGVLFNQTLPQPVKHIWVPHSLGAIKKGNLPPAQWRGLRINERIANEKSLVRELDGIASTSSLITRSLREDYKYAKAPLFLPPCVKPDRYYPHEIPDEHEVWPFLSRQTGLSEQELRERRIITEISRTDVTKRKDVLIKAFARVHRRIPDSLLVVSVDDRREALAQALKDLIKDLDLGNDVATVGSIWDLLPSIYAITDVYCTPAIVEGFGMSAQEAAATAVPVVASHRVPFACEYLLGPDIEQVTFAGDRAPLQVGKGAIVVQADDDRGFARAVEMLLADDALRRKMGDNAYRATVPYFTWRNMVTAFLKDIGASP